MDTVLHLTLLLGMCSLNLIKVEAQPLVEVEQGTLKGKTVQFAEQEFININRDIHAYEGVPYAEPPSRFERPEKKAHWNGIWDATYPRSACIQNPAATLGLPISEDCLYLNIYVPSGVSVMQGVRKTSLFLTLKDSNNCFTHKNVFQNDVNTLSKNRKS